MKRALAIGGGLVVVLVLVIGIGAYYVLTNLGSIIVAAVEKYGSEVTRTEVSLAQADVDIGAGQGALRGLKVGNPSGFETDSAFNLGEISVTLDTGSVTSDTIVLKEIVVGAPEVTYELALDGGSNIDAIRKNVAAYGGGGSGSGSSSDSSGGEPEKKLVIDNLYIRDAKVNVSAAFLKGQKQSASIPDIHLTDIGKDSGGATPEQVAQLIIASLSDETGKAVAGLNLDALKKGAEAATEIIEKGTEAATESVGAEAGKAVEEGAKEAGDKLKKLLGD